MATESATTSLHTPTTTTSPDEPVETMVNEEVKPIDRGTVSLPEEGKVENPKIEELPSETKPLPKSDGGVENKQTQPLAVEVKIGDSSAVDVLVEDKIEMEQDIPRSHAHSYLEPASDAVNSRPVVEPAIECVAEVQEEQQATKSVEKMQKEQPKIVDVPELSIEAVEKAKELLAILPTKESEEVVEVPEDSKVVPKEVDKQESIVPEVDVELEEQSDITEQGGKPQSVEEIGKQQEIPEVPAINESEAVVKDIEASTASSKEINEPVPEVTPKEQSEVVKQDEKVASIEAIEKQQESSEALPVKESEAVLVKDIEDSAVSEGVDKPESVVPEVEVKPKEQSVIEEVKKPESLEAEADLKAKVEYEVPEKVKGETAIDEGSLADRVEDTTSLKEEKTSKEEEHGAASEQVVSAKQEAQADVKEDKGESSLPYGAGITDVENRKEETNGTEVVEAPSKEAAVEMENGGEEREEKTIITGDENVERVGVNEELVQPIKVDDVKEAVSNAEVAERSFEVEKTGKVIEPVVENKKEEDIKEETPALVETSKDGSIQGKLDEATTTVIVPVKESQYSGLAVKDKENAKISEDKVGKENAEEIAKSNARNLEPSTKNGDVAKASQDLLREVPAKTTQKQSNNILTKVKQSLVKAKKAIIGPSNIV
ncbi:hypothetical protein GH714_026581 [Hevea brasiliensis]|uniref:Uncharacterized protein n=1 Tax=Hevea brasiliensis TaxID=3981 RepID=A0A6A6M0Z1_HEVBR|nr:hypothetical protein GH714_026581 [Hevea brasiliensis]